MYLITFSMAYISIKTKEILRTPKTFFGSECVVPLSFIDDLYNCENLIDEIVAYCR